MGYLRLSDLRDEDLTDDGEVKSFGAREKALRRLAAGLGWPIIEIIVENDMARRRDGKVRGVSAFKKKTVILADGTTAQRVWRPGFRKVLDYLATGRANALVTEDLERLMREPRDNEDLIEIVEARGINARSLSGSLTFTDGGKDSEITTARIMVAIANQSSRDTRRRVANGRKRKADRGEWGGGPRPYAFEPDGVTIRPDEADIVRVCSERVLLIDARTKKPTALRALARELREADVPTCTGAQWSARTLRDILLRPRNAGILAHNGDELGPAPWRPIVPVHVFRRVVALLTDKARTTASGAPAEWLGSGLFRCGLCDDGTTCTVTQGNRVLKQTDADGTVTNIAVGKRAPRYRCSEHNHLTRNVAYVNDLVKRATIARLSQPDAITLLPPVANTSGVDLDELSTEANLIRERLNDLAADYALGRGEFDKAQFTTASKAARDRLAEIDAQVKSTVVSPLSLLIGAEDVAAEWDLRTFSEQQTILDALYEVTILPSGRCGKGFRPELIKITERSTLPPVDAERVAA